MKNRKRRAILPLLMELLASKYDFRYDTDRIEVRVLAAGRLTP